MTFQRVESFTDRRGLSVSAGDEVAYAIRSGNTGALRVGVVKEVWFSEWWLAERPWLQDKVRREAWEIVVMAEGGSKPSRLEHPERIVKVRSAKEIELAEREAELNAHPRLITFGEAAYDA